MRKTLFYLFLLGLYPAFANDSVLLSTQTISARIPIKSWKTLRDARIVKQDLDYSCGAASMATILNEFYGQEVTERELLDAMDKGDFYDRKVTEKELLEAMDKGDLRASFQDMQRALPQFGFKAQGFAASYGQLAKLKIPVVVYLKHRKDDHFSVLRGIDGNTVWLADPSLGNRTFSKFQFLNMWETRKGEQDNADLSGKFLALLPIQSNIVSVEDFFTKTPKRQTAQAVEQLAIRRIP
uniref:Peptidase C39 domain-containing protein n=1 Tax=Candidatus Kentrum sp. LPFa TaxID=2126335 RepID=A0A450W387_9GAMM|nr:MAG: hypothetical protein BECKLPF1236A_GA0070988_100552 [Candidatus Kentron sp. LPFa]VFK24567.1 MAG: hypothetical protein BECKLPF1236C_GA0070990_1001423 [Candidatus Kentron sp. LPFa]